MTCRGPAGAAGHAAGRMQDGAPGQMSDALVPYHAGEPGTPNSKPAGCRGCDR